MPAVAIGNATVISSPTATSTATFTVSLSAASTQTVTVEYVTADGTALAGSDYRAVPPMVLTFTPGQTQQTVTVTVNPEPAGAAVKTFLVNLFDPNGATIVAGQATGTINPPVAATLAIASATVIANARATTEASFVVTLSAPAAQPVSVAYATADGTAMAGVDYVAGSGSLTFMPGQPLAQTIMVQVKAEPQYDVSKTFTVNLSSPVGREHRDEPGHRHDRQPQSRAGGLDRQCGGDRQRERHDHARTSPSACRRPRPSR